MGILPIDAEAVQQTTAKVRVVEASVDLVRHFVADLEVNFTSPERAGDAAWPSWQACPIRWSFI